MKRWLWITLVGSTLVVVSLLTLAANVPFSSEILRQRLMASLETGFDSNVELADLHIRLLPRFHAEGIGLTVGTKRDSDRDGDGPVHIAVARLSVDAGLLGLARGHVTQVALAGLEVRISSRDHPGHGPDDTHAGRATAGERSTDTWMTSHAAAFVRRQAVIDQLVATDARLVIVPKDAGKDPRVWTIHELLMRAVAFDRAMPFRATLTNAIPPGEIGTAGSFGPWQAADPSATPLDGTFTLASADLGIFDGIRGVLSARGAFGGSLGRIGIHGETDTPRFTVAVSGHPVSLHTDYHATVDGTTGDTRLDSITGSFLKSHFAAKGSVVETRRLGGHTVSLDLTFDRARLEDLLRLAVKVEKPPMTGALRLKTTFMLPPGRRDVVDKLRLDGQFVIGAARFTDLDIQRKVNELSGRSRGQAPDSPKQNVLSDFRGRFRLGSGTLTLSQLMFETPGTHIELAGTYQLHPEMLDFKGTLRMDAKLSETQRGISRLLLKIVDPLFGRPGGGSAIPFKIDGSRSDPVFGLDRSRLFRRSPS